MYSLALNRAPSSLHGRKRQVASHSEEGEDWVGAENHRGLNQKMINENLLETFPLKTPGVWV